jgi:hypothetical protein
MRRLLAVVALGGLALAGAGCDNAPAAPAAAATASRSASPSPTVDQYAANTREVCAAVNQLIVDGAARFGSDVGAMVGHLAGGNQAEAGKSRAAALAGLKDLAGRIRSAGQPGADPRVVTAVGTVADNLERLAADPTLLDGVRSAADVPAVDQKITAAATGLTSVCV